MGKARLNVCMVTPHLPPDQAANALLPRLLGDRLTEDGHHVSYVAFAPRAGAPEPNGTVRIEPPRRDSGWRSRMRLPQARTAVEVCFKARRLLAQADVVHVHSNTFMNQVAAALTTAHRRPFVLTHYGTEIWHRKAGHRRLDPFLWMNEHAAHVTYYSRRLLDRSRELGIVPLSASVVYPPVDERFRFASPEDRETARRALGVGAAPCLLNVKRLHPLASQRTLVEALPEVLRDFPETKLFIAGEGESRPELEARIKSLGLEGNVRLLGLVENCELPAYYAAADLFVLPSLLEAFPTVAAEALASGTPLISAEHPGGLELQELFPEDVTLTPREDPTALARALVAGLKAPRRSSAKTRARIESEFRPATAYARYLGIYLEAASSHGASVA